MISKELLKEIKIISENLKKRDRKLKLDLSENESIFIALTKITEEVWELNSEVFNKYFKKDKFSKENLKGEFADVIITTLLLAKSLNLDINEALNYKLNIIKQRWWI